MVKRKANREFSKAFNWNWNTFVGAISEWIDGKWCAEQILNIDSTDWMSLLWLYFFFCSIRYSVCASSLFCACEYFFYHLFSAFFTTLSSVVNVVFSLLYHSLEFRFYFSYSIEIKCTCWFVISFVFRYR